jgi:serine phosphatase RsbU (regulator of sigma subunit)/CHASE2 domain-containing sensor protein
LVCALVLALDLPGVAVWREPLFDAYQKVFPRIRASAPAMIVDIDEASLEARGQWPWPRSLVAELMHAIARAGPAAVGVDLLFVEPDRSTPGADAALAQALQGGKFVLGIAGLDHRDRRFRLPPKAAPVRQSSARALPLRRFEAHLQSLPEIDRAAAGRGLLSVDTADRIIRRVPLAVRVGEVVVPALSVEMLRVATGTPMLAIEDRGGERVALVPGDVAIPVQSDGTLRVHFGPHDRARFVSADDVLSGSAGPELRDKLVLVGVTGLGLLDFQATPLGERVPGVEIHAQILEQIFDGVYLRRPTGAALLEAGLLLAGGLALVAFVPRARAYWSALLMAALLALYIALGLAGFKAGTLIDVAGPALGTLAVFGALLAATLAEADRQRRLLREAQARVAGELEAARRIQMGLLPAPRVVFAAEARFSLDARLEPARIVGGDFYDCFMLDANRLFFAVADVSGKGLAASLFMALAKSLLKSIALRSGADPGAILIQASAEIARDNPESFFVTAFAGILDARSGALEFCNAGHEPPYLCRPAGAPERLEHPGGPPLCVIEGFAYASARCTLAPGEALCVITDGVTEAMDPAGALYGRARLTRLLDGAADPGTTLSVLRDDVRRFSAGNEQADDLTLLCVKFNG